MEALVEEMHKKVHLLVLVNCKAKEQNVCGCLGLCCVDLEVVGLDSVGSEGLKGTQLCLLQVQGWVVVVLDCKPHESSEVARATEH